MPRLRPPPPYLENASIIGPPLHPVLPSHTRVGLQGAEYAEIPLSTAEVREQQTDALFREGTVADSAYVSACASRSINDLKSYEELREYDTMEPPEVQSRLTADQQTLYTSSVLPPGSDYINDLCSDIHMKLKYELQNHAHDRPRIVLPKCLPDLVKEFSIRIGLDTSEPSRAYIMHFFHRHHRSVCQAYMRFDGSN
jgi:hypothetical protein